MLLQEVMDAVVVLCKWTGSKAFIAQALA